MNAMEPARWRQVREVFDAARELAASERAAYVAARCDGDETLRREVESLLAVDDRSSPLDRPATRLTAPPTEEELAPGERLGAYRIVGPIGRGGMGEVYLAERADAEFERRVAVKVLRGDLGRSELVERMRGERQILAGLEHPNIARLYEGGTTADGRPFLVMEHVEGEPLDRYCAARRLPLAERLRLFRDVCTAVAFLHRNLLVHRDLKPGNILVTADGTPKLLDFGIAKPIPPEPGEGTLTQTGMRPLTPLFASPEQLRGEAVTTASDVYSLGVLLALLLTGRPPYRGDLTTPVEMERAICEEPPERPSLALAQATDEAPPFSPRALTGDLDNVVLMALRKEPGRRYSSAEQLAEDIDRHLVHLPVSARPDTWGYRLGKLVRRHRLATALAALLAASLVGSLAVVSAQARRAERERDKARVALRFMSRLFDLADPSTRKGQPPTLRDVLDAGAERIERELAGQPEAKLDLMSRMARAYTQIGASDRSLALVDKALSLSRSTFGPGDVTEAQLHEEAGWARLVAGQLEAAEGSFRQALDIRRAALGDDHPDLAVALRGLGSCLGQEGRYDEAREQLERALALQRRRQPPDPLLEAAAEEDLGRTLFAVGEPDEAAELYRQAIALREPIYGADHFTVALDRASLGSMLADSDPAEAERLLRGAVARLEEIVDGAPQHDLAASLDTLGFVLYKRGQADEGERYIRRALEMSRSLFPGDHMTVAQGLSKLGILVNERGRFAEADALYREAMEMYSRILGPDHYQVGRLLYLIGDNDLGRGRLAEAEEGMRRGLAVVEGHLGPDHPALSYIHLGLAGVLLKRGDAAGALEQAQAAASLLRRVAPDDRLRRAGADGMVGECLTALGRLDEAAPLLERSLAVFTAELPADERRVVKAHERLDALRRGQGEGGGGGGAPAATPPVAPPP